MYSTKNQRVKSDADTTVLAISTLKKKQFPKGHNKNQRDIKPDNISVFLNP